MRLERAVADTIALLAIVGVLPIDAPDVGQLHAPDAALVDAITVLRSFHDGRPADVLGDLAMLGATVVDWIPTHRVAGTLAQYSVDHPDEFTTDLAAVAVAKIAHLPLVTGLPTLVGVDDDVAVAVLLRRRTALTTDQRRVIERRRRVARDRLRRVRLFPSSWCRWST